MGGILQDFCLVCDESKLTGKFATFENRLKPLEPDSMIK